MRFWFKKRSPPHIHTPKPIYATTTFYGDINIVYRCKGCGKITSEKILKQVSSSYDVVRQLNKLFEFQSEDEYKNEIDNILNGDS